MSGRMWGRMWGRMLGPMWGQFHSSDSPLRRIITKSCIGPTNYCPGLPVTARSRTLLPGDKIKTSRVTEQVFLYFKHIFMYVLL